MYTQNTGSDMPDWNTGTGKTQGAFSAFEFINKHDYPPYVIAGKKVFILIKQ